MDSLTQIVLGAAVGEAVLGKKIGTRAMMWGAIAGTIPDLDVFLRFFTDDITATEMHRGFSHSLVFSILFAPILAWIAHKIHHKREGTRRDWIWLFFLALVTHPILDMHTTWGTQFLWPFEVRITWNNIFVADPLYTLPFLACLIIAMCYKLTNPRRQFFNNLGLIISTSYMALTFISKGIGYNAVDESLAKQGIDYVELETVPSPLNAILWDAHVETKTGYRFGHYSLFDDSKPVFFSEEFPKNHEMLDSIKNAPVVKQIVKIANGWYTLEKIDGRLYFNDLRFGQFGMNPNTAKFGWRYEIWKNKDGSVSAKKLDPKFDNMGKVFNSLWRRMKGDKSVEME